MIVSELPTFNVINSCENIIILFFKKRCSDFHIIEIRLAPHMDDGSMLCPP